MLIAESGSSGTIEICTKRETFGTQLCSDLHYQSPKIEIVETLVEIGFAGSPDDDSDDPNVIVPSVPQG